MLGLVDRALIIAVDAHAGVRNKHDDSLYIQHPLAVWRLCRDEGLGEIEQAIALIHDVPEDSHWTIGDLTPWFQDEPMVLIGVEAITKRKGESNEDYYHRVDGVPHAARVKLRDMHHNFMRNHLIEDEAKRARMARKYSLGMDILGHHRSSVLPPA